MENDQLSASVGLAAAQAGRDSAASRVRSPWWYYPLFGLGYAGVGIAFAVGGTLVQFIALVGFIVAGRLLQARYRRVKGFWLSGLRSGSATLWSIGWLIFAIGVMVAGWLMVGRFSQLWPAWVMAALIFFGTVAYGHFFERAIRSQLRSVGR